MAGHSEIDGYNVFRHSWVRQHLAPYRKYYIQILGIVAVTISINFAIPLTNRALVNTGILTEDPRFVNLVLLFQSVLYASLIGLNAIRFKISAHISNRLVPRMTSEYFSQVVHLPMGFFHGARSGEVVERVRDLEKVQRFASVELVEAFAGSISILSLSLLLLWIDPLVCAIFVSSAVIYLLWVKLVGRSRRQMDAERFKEGSRSRALEINIVDAIQDIKIAGHEEAALSRWSAVQVDALRTRLRAAAIEQAQTWGGHFFTRVGMVLITYVTARKAIVGDITLGDFTITSVLVVQLYFHLNQLLEFSNRLEDVRAALKRALEVHAMAPETAPKSAPDLAPLAGQPIDLAGVTFRYPGAARNSLENISFTIAPGAMTALIGPSGSGKSTILKLLLRLYEPCSGEIRVGSAPLQNIGHPRWRLQIGAVMQEGALFAGTIRENIQTNLGDDEAWLEEVIEAACLPDVLASTEHGIETPVGPGGSRLSSGQVQRILIARAIFKRPSLLLLDEATSALDGRNEASILRNVRSLLPDATTVVAAHRLNTVLDAYQVVDIDAGGVRGIGSPQSILGAHVRPVELAG